MLDTVPMDDRDTKGDLYEYMLGKIAAAGQNDQFRTPRHAIGLMVEMMEPQPQDRICDPAAGTCGFLVTAGEYLREHHPALLRDPKLRRHFYQGLFHGYDFDPAMLRIGAMNMILHGVEDADVAYRDSLAQEHMEDAGTYTLVLANPPFAGSLDYESTAKDLQRIVKTKKTELLFLALFLRLLKTGVGGTDAVWFYDVQADGYSLDDKRNPLLPAEKLGPRPREPLAEDEHARNNLPDVLRRW